MNNYGQIPYGRHDNFNNFPVNTNIILVTSLEEALARTTAFNSDMAYYHQDLNIMYRIKVDGQGRKSWDQYNISKPDPNTIAPATRADLQSFDDRIKAIERKLFGMENKDAESNE